MEKELQKKIVKQIERICEKQYRKGFQQGFDACEKNELSGEMPGLNFQQDNNCLIKQ